MDGGSKDGSVEIIKKYEKYLSYWQSQPDGGQYIAINDAFKNTTGEIMAWLNSDDKYHQNAFFKVVSAFTNHQEIQWLTGRATAWNRDGKFTYFEASIPEWSREYLLNLTQEIRERRRFIQQESTFWKRSLWEQAGSQLNLQLELAGDFELWVRFSRYASLFPIDDFLGGFRSYEGQRSKLYIDKYMQEVEWVVNQELLLENGEYNRSIPAPEPIVVRLPLGEIFANKNSKEQQDDNGDQTTVTILEKGEHEGHSHQKDDVVIVTSIAPRNQEKQRVAIESWQALGFSVVSLNIQSEIDQLQPLYQNVLFHAVTRDAHSEAGRPLVYLDDVLLYLRQHGTRIGGIVNSDICLKADSNFRLFIAEESVNSLVFGNRINLASIDDVYLQSLDWIDNTVGKYEHGFDYFFFDTSVIDLYPTEAFCIGMPWWDYWMPAALLPTNVDLKLLDSRVAYHVVHPTNFSDLAWRKYGMKIGKYFLSYNSYAEMVEEIQSPNYEHDNWYTFHPLVELGDYILEKIYKSKRTKIIKYCPHQYGTQQDVSIEFDNSIQQPSHHYKVSAIVSTYNSGKFIRDCLQDLIEQTLYIKGLLEIIVIDSASEQNEQEIVREFQKTYRNIVYHRTSERETLYSSWNRAIKMSCGAYITNANTDDRHRPDALEVMASYLDTHPQTTLVYADQLITTTPNDTWETTKANQRWNWPSFDYSELERRCILGSQPMWRKSLHEKYGYFRSELTSAGDYEFWLRIGKTENIVRLPEILGIYYHNEQGLEHASPTAHQETYRILNEYGIPQRGIIPTTSLPVPISTTSELKALPHRRTAQPLVSVIIPTKDRPEMLGEAVKSVLNQTYPHVEVIVVNDGGTDVQEVLNSVNTKGNVVYLSHPQNQERSAARNTGIRVAHGKYIAYLDDDDIYYPNHIKTLVQFLENSEYQVAYTDAVLAQQQKQDGKYVTVHRSVPYSIDFDHDNILVGNFIPILCLIHEKSCLDEVGLFDETLSTHEDWDLIIRLSRKFSIAHIKETTCEFTQRNDGTNTSSLHRVDFTRTREVIYKKYCQYAESNLSILEDQKEALIAEAKELAQQVQHLQSQVTQKESQLHQTQAERSNLLAQVET
jgi:glycosyltransferase involved in cell wall biosynthesis